MTNSSDESLSDADLTTGDTPTASSMPSDADGTDGGDADGDSTDSTDGDSTDADGTDGGDADATDG
jgi:hypothetical protein